MYDAAVQGVGFAGKAERGMDMNHILGELDALIAAGELEHAERFLRDRLVESEGQDGASLTLCNELEGVLRVTGRPEEAVCFAERALALASRLGLEGSLPYATTLLNAATACRAAGKLDRSLELYRQAGAVCHGLGLEESYQAAALWNNLSQVYQEMNRHSEALECLERALEKILPLGGAAEAATTRVNMALSLLALGRPEDADARLSEAMAYYDGEGAGDPHRASALSAAGELAYRRGEKERAVSLLERALEALPRGYGESGARRIIRENLAAIRAER